MAHDAAQDWVSRMADEAVAEWRSRGGHGPVVCASGLSPSGPIHLGNLREVMTPHLVADEIRRRGLECVHLLSWDDYDRFRRVPAGVDPAWEQHIGKPLSHVPPPAGSEHSNWAEHFRAPLQQALAELGIEVRAVSQTTQYTSGAYRDQIQQAIRERRRIDAILDRFRTKDRPTDDDDPPAAEYFPYRPYCSVCDRDLTTVESYDAAAAALAYRCQCGHAETVDLTTYHRGKLVWKVDWPMRWAYEGVHFEPSGVDHTSPGSSYDVGRQLVTEVFGGRPPLGPRYGFVGTSGMAKMSSSKGEVPIPMDALRIMEAPVLRWLYARRRPHQSITVAFNNELGRIYDEWDALGRRVAAGEALPADRAAHDRAVRTAAEALPLTPRPLPYRTLASVVDVTTDEPDQTRRILADLGVTDLDEVQPRLDRVRHWVHHYLPGEQRTRVREQPDTARLAALGDTEQEALRLLLDGLDGHWSLDGLTTLVYGVPKRQAGLPMDASPTPELKRAQREFFALLYQLLVDSDTGPRLPTLLLAVGAARVRKLLGG